MFVFFSSNPMATDRENRHLACALKQENAKLTIEVAKLRIDLAFNKDKASLYDQVKCEVEFYKNKVA